MSAFYLLLRGRVAALQADALQSSVPRAGATPRADARKLSHPSLRPVPPHPTSA